MSGVKDLLNAMQASSEHARQTVYDAHEFARQAHEGQTRYSGEPYFNHVYATAYALAEVGMGPKTIAAGLLHDVVEDAGISEDTLRQRFGDEVLFLVQGVTKLGTVRYRGLQRHTESLRKLFVAMSQDVRVVIIKLMDRLHNMQTLNHVPEHKRERIAKETLEIYAPIADRLGMGRLKRDLEDLAFPYVEPEAYERMQSLLSEKRSQADEYVQKLLKSLKKELASQGFRQFRTDYRVKGLYSLYTKLQRKSWDMEKIHDLYAIRIIVPSVSDCYTVLGIVHNAWRPLPGKIKDYIAFRKPNGYRSLHTTIFSGDGGTVEIQIRTEEMHREAQYGIASHFAYKEEQEGRRTGIRNNLQWFRQLLAGQRRNQQPSDEQTDAAHSADLRATPSWIQELAETQNGELESATSPRQFLNTIKADFFCHRIFVFTPDDDAVDLPIHSTPIDFAYAIHSDIGNHAVGAQVNGKQAALSRKLENGDIVKIETSKHAHPTSKWLNIAKTALARKHIRASLSRAGTDERSHIGKAASGKWK